MTEFTIHDANERSANSYADLREEIRRMAEAELEGARPVADVPRRSLLSRLFTRQATRLAA
jgi:hypothetical protein